jgi:hypothetical protein
MSTISTMSFNWLPLPSAYQQAQNWALRQQALRQQTDDLASLSDTLASAATDQIQGMMNITAQTALARTQAAARTKVNSVLASSDNASSSSSASSTSSSLTLPNGQTITDDPTQYLPGGSRLNLQAGTLTLADGTVIDTTTGLKKIDLTV